MSDMRATERLLEVIEEIATDLADGTIMPSGNVARLQLLPAITELRRRGDTLVRREDLVLVLESEGEPQFDYRFAIDEAAVSAARERLENTIGRKP